ncbi:hypothetical protein E4U55_001859 [Claviceps digitariae]|nr:hypothetical protein E4U55_001859 [Claviceps digitariae]
MEQDSGFKGERTKQSPTPADVRRTFEKLPRIDVPRTQEDYDRYLQGDLRSVCVHKLPRAELLHSSDIDVSYSTGRMCQNCSKIIDAAHIMAERRSRFMAWNFFGYSVEQRCYVFKGQRRLMDDFLDKTTDLLQEGQMEMVLFQPDFIQQPIEGHNPNVTYEQFADYIEHWLCVVLLKSGLEDPLKFDHMASLLKVSPAEMYGRESYGTLVPVSEDEDETREPKRLVKKVVKEASGEAEKLNEGLGTAGNGCETRGRYSLRRRSSSVKYT